MKLYTYFRSSAAFRVRIAQNLKKLAYEPVFVHLAKGEHRKPEYRAIDPQGLLPTWRRRTRSRRCCPGMRAGARPFAAFRC